ncbi:hypothetical protein [Mycolicibacterium aichiense]|uniref:Integral membrane protein n=1 Tax=Mycolicibacterium aichiense TaxID=1799 RepID=A0AAD1HLU9_9MYCO|nr:hypothetical protein [Mycolicibacterium aichiense]MCV7020152.1 hypothetical protein [Mycolicibacterium aichiense]BBX07747.1 hypothetical protein MAIC_25500 [Mycolicibacterium aichiense]STZ81560.1 integral membrane protein [Mycolicibacterium aichiense]
MTPAAARDVHEWFLARGLPLVLTRRVRSRRLIARSAPVVSGIGALIAVTTVIADVSDGHAEIGSVVRLGTMAVVLTAAPFVLYLLHRAGTTRSEAGRRSAALLVMALFVIGFPLVDRGWTGLTAAEVAGFGVIALLAIWLTYLGIGSIVLWAFRFAWVQFGALGTLMSRALPLLMLTVVVYFTGELWQLSARMTRERLWQTIGFLALVALVFMVVTIRDEVSALREDRSGPRDTAALLAGTPLATRTDPVRTPLSTAEQVNVVAVMVVAQAIQVVFFTTGLFAFFLALGTIAIPDDVTVLWSAEQSCPVGQPPCAGTWFGIHVPIPQTVVHTSLFVAVLSGLYFTVSTSVDPLYRQRFFDPLVADVAVSLAGRDAYLEMEASDDPAR